ncbi:MAG: hypothetical protein AAGA21_10850 [Pseudomonadota bacterium]
MNYLRDHWRGRHALFRAFWINAFIPFVAIAMIEPWIRPPVAGGSVLQATLATLFIVIAHAVILPWQIVGLWRSSRRHLEERGDLMLVTFAQVTIVIALVTVAGATTTTVQRVIGYQAETSAGDVRTGARHTFTVLPDARTIVIDGNFDVGLSKEFAHLLAERPDTERIILNSDGGRVFEARGVAKQIIERRLHTHVVERCRSACTIAFIAGSRRTLAEEGKLGFHSYRLNAALALTDPIAEQEKDKAFFLKQGLDSDFVDRALATPHDDMWHPEVKELLRANVVHRIGEGR